MKVHVYNGGLPNTTNREDFELNIPIEDPGSIGTPVVSSWYSKFNIERGRKGRE